MHLKTIIPGCIAALYFHSDVAFAQSVANQLESSYTDEIIVTARRRSETLQDVPLTISAFSSEDISRSGAQDLEDISFQTPGLNFNTNLGTIYPGREGASVRFRGIGDAEGAEITRLQPTSVFIDGAFVLNGAQSIGLVDLDRIEVIKGPQSALFGRNSFAGAINYVTRNPNLQSTQGKISAQAATFNQFEGYASIEGPIIADKLSGLLSVRGYNKGSMFETSDGGELGKEQSLSISGVLYAEPKNNFNIKLRGFYQQDDDGPAVAGFIPGRLADTCTGRSFEGLDDAGVAVILEPTRFICGDVPQIDELGFNPIDFNTALNPSGFAPNFLVDNLIGANRIDGVPKLDDFGLRRDIFRLSLKSEYEFENGMTLSLLGAYNDNKAAVARDLDLTPTVSWYQYNARTGEDKSIDVQLSSADEQRITWLLGATYYDQEFLTSSTGGTFVAACAFPGCPLVLPTPDDGGDDVEVFGVYASTNITITDQFKVGLEGRYQEDTRSDGVSGIEQTFSEFLPRITLAYEPLEDINLYGSWSRGFLPGLVNAGVINCSEASYASPFTDPVTGLPSTASECDQLREQLGGSFAEFTDSQTLDAFEVGFKAQFANGRANLNAAAYFYDWSNQPSTNFATVFRDDDGDGVPNETINTTQIFSAGSSKSRGVELDGSIYANENWIVEGSVSYNDNEYTDYLGLVTFARANGGSRNFQGNRAARFPKWSGSMSSTYTQTLNADWEGYVRGDLLVQGETFTGSDNLATIEAFNLVNARVGAEKDGLRLELFVNNLFDEDKWRSGLGFFDVGNIPGTFDFNNLGVTVIPQDKRTVGVKAELDF